MKIIQCYQTLDGTIHTSHEAAISHADKKYGELVTSLAHKVASIQKYAGAIDWIDSEEFADAVQKLAQLKGDLKIQKDSDEYED